VGLPTARHKNVTIWLRFNWLSGQNRSCAHPVVMPLATIHTTACRYGASTPTSGIFDTSVTTNSDDADLRLPSVTV